MDEPFAGTKLQASRRTYNRVNYHAERRQALDKWAAHLMQLVGAKPKAAGAKASPKALKAVA